MNTKLLIRSIKILEIRKPAISTTLEINLVGSTLFESIPISLTMILVIFTFILTLVALVSEKIDKTALALISATITGIILYIFPAKVEIAENKGEDITTTFLFDHLPWDTIMFIFAMMMVVTMASHSGVFQYIAVRTIQATKGEPKKLYITFIIITFIVSFIFDTVTTMLIIGPVTIEVMQIIGRDFRPYLIAEALVANFASIPSLIGSIPNIVIGGATGLTFLQFLVVLGPLALILLVVSIPILLVYHSKHLNVESTENEITERIFLLDPKVVIKDRALFIRSIIAVLVLIIGFTIGQSLEPKIPAVLTAMVAMLILLLEPNVAIKKHLKDLQWGTVYFIIGLLFIIQAMEEMGVIEIAAGFLGPIVENSPELGTGLLMGTSWLLSGLIDNIPVSAALAPLATNLGGPLIALALIFGVNVGGYVLPISSPANILAISYAEKEHSPISFIEFFKIGVSLATLHLIIGFFYFIIFGSFFEGLEFLDLK
ncbi:MAG: Arsenical pump membrane protein [Candidatus Heimdallarchaeota archaeon LC_3]|nr:MAG: Arsenical pump membrane protein [Candidatus Heimdallarchaeota archaeon LC_3]